MGDGKFSVVYQAEDMETNEIVAIKELVPSKSNQFY